LSPTTCTAWRPARGRYFIFINTRFAGRFVSDRDHFSFATLETTVELLLLSTRWQFVSRAQEEKAF